MNRSCSLGVPVLAALSLACGACSNNGPDTPAFVETEDISVCAPGAGPYGHALTNPYFPMSVGRQLILEGIEGGQAVLLEITVLPDTELVGGAWTRVIEERETVDGALLEVSRNFFVQTAGGAVCYFGEDVDIYEGGAIISHDGAWRAGVAGAVSGLFMPAAPAEGMGFRQEVAPGVAEDRVMITTVGEAVTVPAGSYGNTVRFEETTPLEPGVVSKKVYVSGVGPVVDNVVRLTSLTP
ncbi:MAG: hypothetical protein IPL76_04490 [Gemmatimonadetes bacterium]|nr:hypothetical protein [Gemmatimonadota bacterium]